ncbi:MAG: amidohydrolase family protein, partial [Solimonas sp.]
ALHAATLAGARALGLDAEIGSLAAGKSADFIAVDLKSAATQPVYHVLSHLAYAVGRDQVSDVWVAGRPLLRERRLTTLDEAAVIAKAGEWQRKIRP